MDSALHRMLESISDSFIGRINTNMRETGTDATGKTSASLHYKITDNNGQPSVELLGRKYFQTVETGRKPTPDKMPSKAMIDNITDWCEARGKDESAVWGIAMGIQKKGTKLWQKGGRKDIYSNELGPFTDAIAKATTEYYANQLLKLLAK